MSDEMHENVLASIISGAFVDCGDAVVPSWGACLYVARRVLSVAPPAAQPPDAKPEPVAHSDHAAAPIAERDSWRRVCERLEGEKQAAERALAQIKEAKAVAKVLNSGKVWLDPEADLMQGDLLYAAPQPPAWKGEAKVPPPKWYDLLLAIRKQWMTEDGYFKSIWAGSIREGIDAILKDWHAADAIPREIHDRLVREKDDVIASLQHSYRLLEEERQRLHDKLRQDANG
jgi:hypothetical protein